MKVVVVVVVVVNLVIEMGSQSVPLDRAIPKAPGIRAWGVRDQFDCLLISGWVDVGVCVLWCGPASHIGQG